jgi:hypothetical protein
MFADNGTERFVVEDVLNTCLLPKSEYMETTGTLDEMIVLFYCILQNWEKFC